MRGGEHAPHSAYAAASHPTLSREGQGEGEDSLRQLHPAHLAARADGREAEALDALGDAADLHGVVDPDVRAVGDDRGGSPPRRAAGARSCETVTRALRSSVVDLGVLVLGRRLPGAVELAVVHLADPVLRIDEVGRHPVDPQVGRRFGLEPCCVVMLAQVSETIFRLTPICARSLWNSCARLHWSARAATGCGSRIGRLRSARPRPRPWSQNSLAFFRS